MNVDIVKYLNIFVCISSSMVESYNYESKIRTASQNPDLARIAHLDLLRALLAFDFIAN